MSRPIVIAHHLIWTLYGWWLPNDLRGSSSHTIRSDVIAELGELHEGRKAVQPNSRDIRAFYAEARKKLQHQLFTLSEDDVRELGDVFARVVEAEKYTCYACAIMPDHVHVLIRKHKDTSEQMIRKLQDASRLRLRDGSTFPPDHPVWGGPGWTVFEEHPDDIRRTIRYIEENPIKWHLPRQTWPFVVEYDGWPLHPGHSPNSPYAKRLRAAGRYP